MLNDNSKDYYEVYSYNTNFIRGGTTDLPTGMSTLKHSAIIMRIGDTLIDYDYNLYVIDIKNMSRIYLHSIKSFTFWLSFWFLITVLSFLKMIKTIDSTSLCIIYIMIFIISLSVLFVSLITFFCGVNCYGIEIYDPKLRNLVNNIIKYIIGISLILLIYFLI